MLKTYVFVSSSMNGSDATAIDIRAEDQWNALTKAYEYFGDSKLKVEEFDTLGQYTAIGRMYEIFTELNGCDNAITSVEFESIETYEYGDLSYKIIVYAENKKIKILQVDGNDDNGYYGTGYSIRVKEKSE